MAERRGCSSITEKMEQLMEALGIANMEADLGSVFKYANMPFYDDLLPKLVAVSCKVPFNVKEY